MQISSPASDIYEIVQVLVGITDVRSPRPILACIKMVADEKGSLALYATDLEIAMEAQKDGVDVKEAGAVIVTGNSLAGVLRELEKKTVSLNTEEAYLKIEGNGWVYRLPTYDVGDFPELPAFPKKGTFKVQANDLRDMIKRTVFATAVEETRYTLNGVLFACRKGELELVATDGRRLSRIARRATGVGNQEIKVIVPTKAVNEMLKMLDGEGEVELAVSETQIWVRSNGMTLSSRLVEGRFPDYEAVIPSEDNMKSKAVFERQALETAVRGASLLANEETRMISFNFDGSNQATLKYEGAERGEAEVPVEVEFEGEPLSVTFNPVYFSDVLKVLSVEKVELLLNGAEEAALLRADENFDYVMMPICKEE